MDFTHFENIIKSNEPLDKTGFFICVTVTLVAFSPFIYLMGLLMATAMGL